MRTIVDLPKEQIEALDSYAKTEGHFARRGRAGSCGDLFACQEKRRSTWRKHPAFGSEKMPKGFDSVEYVRKLRAEWDHRADECDY